MLTISVLELENSMLNNLKLHNSYNFSKLEHFMVNNLELDNLICLGIAFCLLKNGIACWELFIFLKTSTVNFFLLPLEE